MPTAEEAAAANLAWRSVNAPSTVTSAEQTQANQYRNQYYNVERPAQDTRDAAIQQTILQNRQMINRQEGLSYGGTHTEAQLRALSGSAAVGRQAIEQEREYYESNPSSEFERITNQYAVMKSGTVVGGNGVYFATGQLELNTTAGEGGFTGRAAQYKSAYDREVYGIGAPDNEREYYRRQALQIVEARPGYTPSSELGDLTTARARAGYSMFSDVMSLQGITLASDGAITGQILEAQRQMAYATPERRDERFFMGELQKWGQGYVETGSAYHHVGMDSGKRIPANPFEYQADLAVELLKGSPTQAKDRFSTVSGELKPYLPDGEGLQGFAWREAITDYKRQNVDARTPYPEQVSFMSAVQYVGAAEGKYGPYGKLYGGIDNGGAGNAENNIAPTTKFDVVAAGLPKPFVSTPIAPVSKDIFTQAGLWLEGAERATIEITGLNKLPTPTTEQIKEMGKNPLFMSTNPAAAAFLIVPQTQEYAASFIRGEAIQIKTKPLESAVNYGIAYAGGVAFKGIAYGAEISRASFAEKAIAGGGGWRAAEMFAANAPRVGGAVLTTAYVASVGGRATEWGRDFSPAASERLGGMAVGEVLPGALGFMHGYKTPSAVYRSAQLSDIGYKASLQEGSTTSRANYYIKQPAIAVYERASVPITRAKLELPQFVEESGGSAFKGTVKYAGYKIGMETPVTPEISRNYYPYEGIERTAYPRASKSTTLEINRNYYPYEGIEKVAYPKGKSIDIGAAIQTRAINIHSKAWPYYQAAKTPGITMRSIWQERGGIDTSSIIRPDAEIARINKLSTFRFPEITKTFGPKQKPMGGISIPTSIRKLTGEKPPITKGVEIKSNGGSLISKVEKILVPKPEIRMSTPEQLSYLPSGIPEWPSGPSPIQRQRYDITEEEQIYRLPPGMVSPGPKRETIQNISVLPMLMTSRSSALEVRSFAMTRQDQMFRSELATSQKQRREFASELTPKLSRVFYSAINPATSQITRQDMRIETTSRFDIATASDRLTRTRLDELAIPTQSSKYRPDEPIGSAREGSKFPFGGMLPGGGGGSRGYGGLGITTWRRDNLVATAEYLGRGMRDIGFGSRFTEALKIKKKTKRKRKK